MVEAALIVPLIILVTVLIIQVTAALHQRVAVNCMEHSELLTTVNQQGELGDFVRTVDFMKGLMEQ